MYYFLSLSILTISLIISSCGSQTQEESAKESLNSAKESLERAGEALEQAEDKIESAENVLDKEKVYCCTNHEPAHCGTVAEMEELIKTTGCSGFEAQGIASE